MEITASLVKELRERTGIWMMECKKALIASNWDIELAIEELRKKWLAKAASKAGRDTMEWWIKIEVEWNKAYLVSVLCETDFLANTDRYKDMLSSVIDALKSWKTKEEAQEMINREYSLEMWENLQLRDFEIIEWEKIAFYVHSNNKLAWIVVWTSSADEEKLRQVAMHVTAANPEFLSTDDITEEVIEKEKSIQLDMMKNDPKMAWKPDDVLAKIIDWKIEKFKSEISLLEQAFVVNPDIKVKDFIWEDNIVAFYRKSI